MGYVGAITLASYPSKKDLPGLSGLEVERRTRALGVWTQSILPAALMQSDFGASCFGASSANPADIIVNSVANTITVLVMTTSFRPGTDLIDGLTVVYLFRANCDLAHAEWPLLAQSGRSCASKSAPDKEPVERPSNFGGRLDLPNRADGYDAMDQGDHRSLKWERS
jgi:hypothetical protein